MFDQSLLSLYSRKFQVLIVLCTKTYHELYLFLYTIDIPLMQNQLSDTIVTKNKLEDIFASVMIFMNHCNMPPEILTYPYYEQRLVTRWCILCLNSVDELCKLGYNHCQWLHNGWCPSSGHIQSTLSDSLTWHYRYFKSYTCWYINSYALALQWWNACKVAQGT